MALDSTSNQKVRAWLASEYNSRCPDCHGTELNIGDLIGLTLASKQVGAQGPDPTKVERYAPVTCVACGHVILVRASTIDI